MTGSEDFVSSEEFEELFQQCSNWGRWGPNDRRGSLNFITSDHVRRASNLILTGTVVSCARTLDTLSAIDNPTPAVHYMTSLPLSDDGPISPGVAADYIGVECHGEVHSHLDALCHISYRGKIFNGWDSATVSEDGGSVHDLEDVSTGIVSRGVLLDIAALRGQRWLDGGESIRPEELVRAEEAGNVTVGSGDVVLIRTGHALRRQIEGPWDSASEKAGLHPRSMPWLREREIAAIGFDGDGDAAPHGCSGIVAPIHVLGINATGLHFFDALSLEDLANECSERGRYEFFFSALPLRVRGATGCVINPAAIL